MNNRRSTKSKSSKGKDPYLLKLHRIWPSILVAYDDFKDKKPIVEYRLPRKIVCVYPALDYINDLTERTREQTRLIYKKAVANGQFMVFVHDADNRVLRSYVFYVEEPVRMYP